MELYIDGVALTDIGSYADVAYTENWRGGCDTASWSMNHARPAGTRHRNEFRDSRLYSGADVRIQDGPVNVWRGDLAEPSSEGQMVAYGLSRAGVGVLALDGSGNPTANPDTAIFAAVNTRGAVPWGQAVTLSAVDVGDPEDGLTLNALLDRYTDSTNIPWGVNHEGLVVGVPAPTTPSWALQIADSDLWSMSDDTYVTHLNVLYLASGPVFATLLVTIDDSAAAAVKWHRVEKTLDLTGVGILTSGEAQAWGESVLARTGPRMQLTDAITLGSGQLMNLGGTVAGWSGVHAGQMIRLWGVPDRSRPNTTLHTDVVIGRVERTRSTLTLTPAGAETQTFEDVVAELFAAA